VLTNGGGLTSRDASHHARLHYDGNLAVYEVNTGAEGGGGSGDGYDDDYLGPLVWEVRLRLQRQNCTWNCSNERNSGTCTWSCVRMK